MSSDHTPAPAAPVGRPHPLCDDRPMDVIECPGQSVPTQLLTQVRLLHEQAWGESDPGRPMHDPALDPWTMMLLDEGQVLAVLDILRKELIHEGHSYRAGGLSSVVTRPGERRRGHGHRLVSAAHERMSELNLDLGLFTCDAPLRPFYERAGWQHLPGTVLVGGTPETPFPSDQPGFDKVTMGDFFSAPARSRREEFVGARVALFPGLLDMLW